jgi:hypothetical protein
VANGYLFANQQAGWIWMGGFVWIGQLMMEWEERGMFGYNRVTGWLYGLNIMMKWRWEDGMHRDDRDGRREIRFFFVSIWERRNRNGMDINLNDRGIDGHLSERNFLLLVPTVGRRHT